MELYMKFLKSLISLIIPLFIVLTTFSLYSAISIVVNDYKKIIISDYAIMVVSNTPLIKTNITKLANIKVQNIQTLKRDQIIENLKSDLSNTSIKLLKQKLPFFYKIYLNDYPTTSQLKIIKNQLKKISNIKIGETGYIYIFNSDALMVHHPDLILEGSNIKKIKNPTKTTFLVDDLMEAYKKDKKLYYKWNKPNDNGNYIYNKLSLIEYIPEFDWYIVSSSYLDEYDQNANKLKKSLEIIGLILMIISILIAALFFHKLDKETEEKTLKLINMQEKLKKLVNIDQLTGLYNRRYFYDTVENIINLAKREGKKLSVLMIDIDNFKKINDTYGHHVGDSTLFQVASIIKKYSNDKNIAIRWGGEEFIIISIDTNKEKTTQMCEDIRKDIDNEVFNIIEKATVSIGCSLSKDIDTFDLIIKRADAALYTAKHNGKNRVEYLS